MPPFVIVSRKVGSELVSGKVGSELDALMSRDAFPRGA